MKLSANDDFYEHQLLAAGEGISGLQPPTGGPNWKIHL